MNNEVSDGADLSMYQNDATLDNLLPALFQCFAVIICGYIAGRLSLVSDEQSSGLATFVGTFSLPALIFLSLASIDLSSVCWYLLLSILVAKAIIFFCVLIVTLVVTKPVDPAKAGLYAIFCTQSNDFAIGLTIIKSVYGASRPDFVSYLYLLAPVSLVILNPIGFFLMELSKARTRSGSKLLLLGNALASIATNPIVLMTALGIIGNLVFKHNIPQLLASVLQVFGSAFTGTALFLLGLRMVGRVQTLQGSALLLTGILIAVKELALPVVAREVTSLVFRGTEQNVTNSTPDTEMSNFAFLYGILPAAPGVFVYATSYNIEVDLIASAMVACTFISGPLMFVSAKMVAASSIKPSALFSALEPFEFDLSVASAFCSVWLFVLFIVNKSYKKLPHAITLFLIATQLIGSVGVISGRAVYAPYLEYGLVKFSQYSSDLWTGTLAVALVILESRGQSSVLTLVPLFIFISSGIPAILVTVFMTTLTNNNPLVHCYEAFAYGKIEAAITIFIQLVSFFVTMGCLIMQQRNRKRYRKYLIYVSEASATSDNLCADSPTNPGDSVTSDPVQHHNEMREDAALCYDGRYQSYRVRSHTFGDEAPDPHMMHHIVLLVFLASSIFINLSLSIWRIISDTITAVYVEMTFLNASLTRGQTIVALFIFGWDTIPLVQPILKKILQDWIGRQAVITPSWDQLPSETQQLCNEFSKNQLDRCKQAISEKKRIRLWESAECFSGTRLVDWLISEGVATGRPEATECAKKLAMGRVLRHVTDALLFQDSPDCFFTFTTR